MDFRSYASSPTLHIIAITALSAASTASIISNGSTIISILLISLLLFTLYRLLKIVRYPIEQVQYFLLALRCGERMIRFPKSSNSTLGDMYSQMNDIIKLYYNNKVEIETKKDYYDRILRIMTHEIRNTVTPIISLTDHYINHSCELNGDDVKEGLKIINSQSHNLKSFLDSYHTLTHLPEPTFTPINTTELFESIGNLLRGEPCGNRIEILSTNVSIKADPVQMQLLLSNLLRNAMQAIEGYEDGKIVIRASISDKQPFITITDNGCGIAPERIKDIFLPFYTTKEKGSGIGLSLCRQIMLLHGGELTVDSSPQKRITTFIMTFPAA